MEKETIMSLLWIGYATVNFFTVDNKVERAIYFIGALIIATLWQTS